MQLITMALRVSPSSFSATEIHLQATREKNRATSDGPRRDTLPICHMARRDAVRLGRGRLRHRDRQRRFGGGGKDFRAEERERTDAARTRESPSCHFTLESARHQPLRGGNVQAAGCRQTAAAPGEKVVQRQEGLVWWSLAQLQRHRQHHLPRLDRPANGVDLRSHGPYVFLPRRHREVKHRGANARPHLHLVQSQPPDQAQVHGEQRHGQGAAYAAGA